MSKILILCSYFQRPKLVKNALNSILLSDSYHQDWEMVFLDDGSLIPGRPIVEEILKDHLKKIKFVKSDMKLEDKLSKGLILGKIANDAIKNSNAEIAIILCDDDELHPEYLKNISRYFKENSSVLYAYSKINIYNPIFQKSEGISNLNHKYNQWDGPINPVGKVDASQVSWRLDCCKFMGAWFEESTNVVKDKPWLIDTDKAFFENLHAKCGDCHPTGFVSQYKGVHDYQLLWHKNAGIDKLRMYEKMCNDFGGEKF